MLQQSDGPWFDSGWPDFFEQRLAGDFHDSLGRANTLSIAPVAFTRSTCTNFVQLGPVCNRPPPWRVASGSRPMVGEPNWWRGGTLSTNRLAKWRRNGSPHWGLNPGPSVYKTDALPLSYRGLMLRLAQAWLKVPATLQSPHGHLESERRRGLTATPPVAVDRE